MSGGAEPAHAQTVRMVHSLLAAARAAGVQPDDPLAPLIEALAQAVGFLGHQRVAMTVTAEKMPERLAAILQDSREVANAEVARFRAECQAAEAETVRSLSIVLADTAEKAMTLRVRALIRLTSILWGLSVITAFAVGAGGGWWIGDRTARSNITTTEDSVRAAFREGPATAARWADLMKWNDLQAVMAACREPANSLMQNGRRACWVPLWIDQAPPVGKR